MCLFIYHRLTARAAPAAGPLGARCERKRASAARALLSLARVRAFPPNAGTRWSGSSGGAARTLSSARKVGRSAHEKGKKHTRN